MCEAQEITNGARNIALLQQHVLARVCVMGTLCVRVCVCGLYVRQTAKQAQRKAKSKPKAKTPHMEGERIFANTSQQYRGVGLQAMPRAQDTATSVHDYVPRFKSAVMDDTLVLVLTHNSHIYCE